MAIKKVEELKFRDKKFSMIIAGFPGIGKTTLALSAPKPLLVDLDNEGISRVLKQHRCDTIFAKDYAELVADLQSPDLKDYETVIFDTGGKLLEFLKPAVIKENPGNGQKDGSLSLKGYGAVARKFKHLTQLCNSLGKNVIYTFHTTEVKDGDLTKLRISVEGSTKDSIWQDVDFGGFIEMRGNDREISFKNCERYFAKGIFGVTGTYAIKNVENAENDFLTKLFEFAKKNAGVESEEEENERLQYEEIMKFKTAITNTENAEQVNLLVDTIKSMQHVRTSERELKTALHTQAISLGLTYDKETQCYG